VGGRASGRPPAWIPFLAGRLGFAVLVVVCVQVVVFLITHTLNSPARLMLPATASTEQVARLERQLGYDRPLLAQLWDLLTGSLTLDFGRSYWQQVPAGGLVLDRLPATLVLVALSIALAVAVAVPLGVLAATRRDSWWDRIAVTVSLVGVSVPAFWLGYLLILLLSVRLGVLPTSGVGTPAHYVLPVVTLAVLPLGRLTQIVRSSMIDELGQQYMLVHLASGLRGRTRIYRHGLKNAGITILTMTGWEVARLISGFTVVVEVVYNWPGVGLLAVQAIKHNDIPLLIATVTIIAVLIVALNFLLDLAYAALDPRLRATRREGT